MQKKRCFCEGDMERAHSEPNEQQSHKSKRNLQQLIILKPFGGQTSDIFGRRYSKSFFRIVLPTRARSTFFKKCGAKSELDHKNHERGIFKLAFLMQVRIRIRRRQFFCSCRHWLVFFENHKIQVYGQFGSAGRNARGRWGEIWGGLEICRFEICNYGLVDRIRHASACHTARAADSKRYAHSAGPDPKYVFSQKHSFLVGFRLYGHVHRLS